MDDKTDTKPKVSVTTLGRKRAEYDNLRKLDGMSEKKINARMSDDAKLYGMTLSEYKAELAKLNKPSKVGKRASDKETRDKLITETQDFLGPVNTAIMSFIGKGTLTPANKIAVFDKIGENAHILSDHLHSAFDNKGGLTFIWTPSEKNPDNLLCVHVAGWGDGSTTERFQYAPRKVPVAKRSGYRDDSFMFPLYEVHEPKRKHAKAKKAKAKHEAVTDTETP